MTSSFVRYWKYRQMRNRVLRGLMKYVQIFLNCKIYYRDAINKQSVKYILLLCVVSAFPDVVYDQTRNVVNALPIYWLIRQKSQCCGSESFSIKRKPSNHVIFHNEVIFTIIILRYSICLIIYHPLLYQEWTRKM